MKNTDVDIVIIGAGVIGLSIGYFFSKQGKKVIILEKEKNFGMGNSSRNTEVIHAGIYYAKNSLKAKLCIDGKQQLYEFCQKYSISFKRTGKLFIATTKEEITALEKIKSQAEINGLMDLKYLKKNEVKNIEPAIECEMAVLSPSSGVVDSYGLMQCLLRLNEDNGALLSTSSPFIDAEYKNKFWKIYIGGVNKTEINTKVVINAAGLNAIKISNQIKSNKEIPFSNPVKGIYLRYSGKSPISHIVYPSLVPGKIEERVDATPDLNKSLRFGPSVEKEEITNTDDYSINSDIKKRFLPSIKKYLPSIDENRLTLDVVGIRPKIKKINNSIPDFIFEWGKEEGWLDLWNIESPGLTASLAIGEHIYNKVKNSNLI